MAMRTIYSASRLDMIDFLNTAIVGSVNLRDGADMDAETLIADIGAGDVVVTFAPLGRDWTLQEIVDQINTDLGVAVASVHLIGEGRTPGPSFAETDRRLKMAYGTLTIRSTGTGNTKLGYSAAADTVGGSIPVAEVETLKFNIRERDTWHLVLYR